MRNEPRRIAANIAKLPELLAKPKKDVSALTDVIRIPG